MLLTVTIKKHKDIEKKEVLCLFDMNKIKDWDKFNKWFNEFYEKVLKDLNFKDIAKKQIVMYYDCGNNPVNYYRWSSIMKNDLNKMRMYINNKKEIQGYIKILKGNKENIYDNMMANKELTNEQFKEYLDTIYSYYKKYKKIEKREVFCLFDMNKIKDWDKFNKWFNEVYDYFKTRIFNNLDLKDVINRKIKVNYIDDIMDYIYQTNNVTDLLTLENMKKEVLNFKNSIENGGYEYDIIPYYESIYEGISDKSTIESTIEND